MDKNIKNTTELVINDNESQNAQELKIKDKDIKVDITRGKFIGLLLISLLGLLGGVLTHQWILGIQAFFLFPLLTYISLVDNKLRLCPDWAHFVVAGLSLINIIYAVVIKNYLGLIMYGLGGILLPLPVFLSMLFSKKGGIGGADLKILIGFGLILGCMKGYIAVFLGLLIGVICTCITRLIKKDKSNDSFALLPYLSIGLILVYYL